MTTYGGSKSPVRNLVEMLRAELAWYPGRPALVGRIVLACTSVMVLADDLSDSRRGIGRRFPDIDFARKSESYPENCISNRPGLFNRNC